MIDDSMNVQALLGKSADADFLREMIGFAAQRLMDLEVGGLTGVGYGEKSSDRLAQRNGYRERCRSASKARPRPRGAKCLNDRVKTESQGGPTGADLHRASIVFSRSFNGLVVVKGGPA